MQEPKVARPLRLRRLYSGLEHGSHAVRKQRPLNERERALGAKLQVASLQVERASGVQPKRLPSRVRHVEPSGKVSSRVARVKVGQRGRLRRVATAAARPTTSRAAAAAATARTAAAAAVAVAVVAVVVSTAARRPARRSARRVVAVAVRVVATVATRRRSGPTGRGAGARASRAESARVVAALRARAPAAAGCTARTTSSATTASRSTVAVVNVAGRAASVSVEGSGVLQGGAPAEELAGGSLALGGAALSNTARALRVGGVVSGKVGG